mmetsp:Transcript_2986/g.4395  ORF Transcript_2986/g.4395 Transcript_2986/m.4395 type:complete len:214 (-) Transcript_2986:275-916(-)|eukprot:CAMPEP_0194215456 /NCGR_PEP_ID=MMETSP0156-20130528/17276_1 /TAXON_ID=33649 /ORGANISM="Thalassionema nitzschioides, Strain L26-B" /LENGTH=213 /DNA_ID=CAMNT_0038943973 /DNA_START=97 /DNA_END=738 /DNA_ORIENTATION=+
MPPSVRTTRLSAAPVNQQSTLTSDDKTNRLESSEVSEENDLGADHATGGMYSGPYGGGYGGGMYGGGIYGSSMMGGMYGGGLHGGGAMSPYGYGSMPHGPLSNLNQFLFGVQNAVFSLGQAVQIIGMNTQAIQQLLDSASTMLDHAIKTYKEIQQLHATEHESEEDKKRRRRLRALRWAAITLVAYTGFKVVRIAFRRKRLVASTRHHQSQFA